MKIKNFIVCATFLWLPLNTQYSIAKNSEEIYDVFAEKQNSHVFPIADILAQWNKFRTDIFQEKLFQENAEYLTDTITFKKIINTERTEETPFPRTIAPLEMDLKQENLRASERAAFIKLRNEVKQYRDKYYTEKLPDNEITKQELHDLNKWIYVLINPNNEGFEHNDSTINNPQLIIVINEFERTITKMPISLGKYGVKKNGEWSTPSWYFSIQTFFDVNASLIPGVETAKSTYLDAVHSWVNSTGNWAYKLNKDFYERQGATMVKWLISIWPWLESIGTSDAKGNISRKRGVFIHGSNSLKERTFGKNASNGCIRMHPANRDVLQKKLIFGTPYKVEDWEEKKLTASLDTTSNASLWNNKIIFEKTQRHDQKYFFTAGSLLYIMEEEKDN